MGVLNHVVGNVRHYRSRCEIRLAFLRRRQDREAELELEAGVVGAFITKLGIELGCSTDDNDDDVEEEEDELNDDNDDGWLTACE